MALSFLDLPRELRNMIYREMWRATPVINLTPCGEFLTVVACLTQQFHGQQSPLFRHQQKVPLWLRTSKQILQEAQEDFVVTGVWDLSLSQNYYEKVCIPSILPIVDARHVILYSTLDAETFTAFTRGQTYHRGFCSIQPDDLDRFNVVVSQLKPKCKMTKLTLEFDVYGEVTDLDKEVNLEGVADVLLGIRLESLDVHLHLRLADYGGTHELLQALSDSMEMFGQKVMGVQPLRSASAGSRVAAAVHIFSMTKAKGQIRGNASPD